MYICQMKCEGEKTYPDPGKCPVCGMKLIHLEGNNQASKDLNNDYN